MNRDGAIVLDGYGRSTGFCVDPIEKKPLSHFLPGSSVLSFGTAGCNLGCRFCQNWTSSKSREVAAMSSEASPDAIADAALAQGCRSVAFTYNDPIVWAEYAIDTAKACHARDLKTVAVTAGYISAEAREAFFAPLDAVNVDLKAFTESFYEKLCFAQLAPVLETLAWLAERPRPWVEITTLVIPTHNDDPSELQRLSAWVVETLGPDTPLHFSAFHPDFKMKDLPRTPLETLVRARKTAMAEGLRYVYTGNVRYPQGDTTHCPSCAHAVIERDRYEILRFDLDEGACPSCGTEIAGVFESAPGRWGRRRLPVHI